MYSHTLLALPPWLSATFFSSTVMTQAAAWSMPWESGTEPEKTDTVVPTLFSASLVMLRVDVFFQGSFTVSALSVSRL
ncbi:hypothetical protein ADK64_32980 [Streptomyces sp. MMG1121]|nr:hypothetical protein ADK64_32980 [Streptomyces sp. MMG1121]